MQLINTRQSQAVATTDPRHTAIIARYGSGDKFNDLWTCERMGKVAEHLPEAVKAQVPSLVMMRNAYGEELVKTNLRILAKGAIAGMGDTRLSDEDARSIADGIMSNQNARTLNYAFVVAFFAKLKSGAIELYNFTPYRVNNAFCKYAKEAQALQMKLMEAERKRKEREAWEEHQKQAVTWEQYCRQKGITEQNPIDFIKKSI